jgi:hypothetical protein
MNHNLISYLKRVGQPSQEAIGSSVASYLVANPVTGYTHPETHPASIIEQNGLNRFVTDVDIDNWNLKAAPDHAHDGYAGAGAIRYRVTLFADGAAVTDTNSPVALQFFKNLPYQSQHRVDLTGFSQVRLIVMKAGTAGASNNKLLLRYSATFSTTAAGFSDIGVSEVSCAVNITNRCIASEWINLVAEAKGDVFIALLSSGGDGALDPVYGNIVCEFK